RGPQRIDQLPGRHVAAADVAHLALVDEIVERAQRLLDRSERVDEVILVEIDPVGLEPFQARLDRAHDVAARTALELALRVHGASKLRRQDDILATPSEHLAQDRLGAAAPAIDVAAVEERDAEIERLVDDGARALEIERAAEIVAAEPDGGDAQARLADVTQFHVRARLLSAAG